MAAVRREAKPQVMTGVTTQKLAALPADAFSTEIALEQPEPISSNERNDVKSTTAVTASGNGTVVFRNDCNVPQRRNKSRSTELETTQIELAPLKGVLPVTCQEHRTTAMAADAASVSTPSSNW